MTYHTNIKHQELVALLGTRNLYLRLVYAHIANYTQVKGAWCGTQRDLAAQLELPIQTVRDQIKTLTTKGLLSINGNTYTAAVPQNTTTVLTDTRAVQNNTAAVQKSDPIINNEIMKSNDIIARDTIATPDPLTQTSFERLLFFFRKRVGNIQLSDGMCNDCRNLWDRFPLWKRLRLFEILNDPNGWCRPRLDWTLTAFNPQPMDLNGTAKGGEMLATGQAKTARYNGTYGVYSLRDIEDFGMTLPQKS